MEYLCKKTKLAVLVASLAISSSSFADAIAEPYVITGFIGGHATDNLGGGSDDYKVHFDKGFEGGLAFDYLFNKNFMFGGIVTGTSSDVDLTTGRNSDSEANLDAKVDIINASLRWRIWGDTTSRLNTNLFGGFGVTHYSYSADIDDSYNPSVHIGAGAIIPINDQFAFRLDGTVYGTYLTDDIEYRGDTVADTKDDVSLSGSILVGLEYKF